MCRVDKDWLKTSSVCGIEFVIVNDRELSNKLVRRRVGTGQFIECDGEWERIE